MFISGVHRIDQWEYGESDNIIMKIINSETKWQ